MNDPSGPSHPTDRSGSPDPSDPSDPPCRPVRDALRADLEAMVLPDGRSRPRWRVEVLAKILVFPRIRAVVYLRLGQLLARHRLLPVAYWLQSRAIRGSGAEISPLARIGPGLCLMHSVGIVVGPKVSTGRRTMLYQGVTLGDGSRPGQPTIGDYVVLGVGAAVLGGVRVGDRVVVGAHAVVVDDLPDDVVAVGAPATWRPRRTDLSPGSRDDSLSVVVKGGLPTPPSTPPVV